MATYLITFRLDYNSTYADRWESVIKAIRAQSVDGKTWEEMTSVILLESDKSADAVARDIYISSDFNTVTDKLLVVNSSNNTYATRGEIDYPATLASFFNSSTSGLLSALSG